MCQKCLFFDIFGKIKKRWELVSYYTNYPLKVKKRGNVKDFRGVFSNRKLIEDRPEIVDLKQRFWDLEIDVTIGKNHKEVIATVNDTQSPGTRS